MSFADELKNTIRNNQQENSADALQDIIENEYTKMLKKLHDHIKANIRHYAENGEYQVEYGKTIIKGAYPIEMHPTSNLPRKFNDCNFDNGAIRNMSDSEYGVSWCEIQWKPLYTLESKPAFNTIKVKVSITHFGEKVISDLTTLLKQDGIHTQLYAEIKGMGEGIQVSDFGIFHKFKYNTHCLKAVLHISYEVYL